MSVNDIEPRTFLPQEPDEVPLQRLVLIGIGVLLVSAVGIWWAWFLTSHPLGGTVRMAGPPAGAALGSREIGMVNQVDYARMIPAQEMRARDRRLLGEWGWVDRQHGIVRMPIDRAMQQIAAEDEGATP